MKVTVEEKDGVTILHLDGEMSIFFKDSLNKIIDEKLKNNDLKMIFNMEKVEYIDSAGLSMIVIVGNKALEQDSKVIIVSPNAQVRHVLEVARIDSIIQIEDSIENALAFYKNLDN